MKTGTKKIQAKRVYDAPAQSDGARFLVERLWPRGVKKVDLVMNAWLKDVAPSNELRKWFHHDPAKWSEFRKRYHAELEQHREAIKPLQDAAKHGPVTLLFSSHDTEHNNAVALQEYLTRTPKLDAKKPTAVAQRSG